MRAVSLFWFYWCRRCWLLLWLWFCVLATSNTHSDTRSLCGKPCGEAHQRGATLPAWWHSLCLSTPHPHPLSTVRVVNNVVKRNDVRSRLYTAVRSEGYPEAFMYKQKVTCLPGRIRKSALYRERVSGILAASMTRTQ